MENFEVFTSHEVDEFIRNHQDFIDQNQSIFNPDYRTLNVRNNYVFNFIKLFFPDCPNKINSEIFKKFNKSLNKVRSEYKKRNRKEEVDDINYEECIGH